MYDFFWKFIDWFNCDEHEFNQIHNIREHMFQIKRNKKFE